MSVYYDLYASGNPQKKDEQQPLHARVIPSGTLDAKKFIELVSKRERNPLSFHPPK